MGLLDSIGFSSSGSLLDSLLYPSPLQTRDDIQYDQMGNAINRASESHPLFSNTFSPIPQQQISAPPPLPQQPAFMNNLGPLSGVGGLNITAPPQQSQSQPQQVAAPSTYAPSQSAQPFRSISIGGYQLPQFGTLADYTPQTPQPPTDVSAQSRQPAQEEQAQVLPPAFGNGSSVLSRIGSPDGLIARLTGNDSRSIAQKNLKAQYDSLVPLVGHQKAMLAVMNPEAGKTILAQVLEKKQYGFQKLDNDTVLRTDPLTGKAEVAYGGGSGNQTGVAGPDGKIIPYPEGLDSSGRKVFANEIARINADSAAGKKTEVQAKSEKFGNKMELSERNLKGLENEGTSLFGQIASGVPLGNYAQSPQYQKYTQAKNNFITALLRDESGAAIGTQEFLRYEKELFPQPGDSAGVIQQKAEARRAATDAMKKSAGPGYKSPTEEAPKVRRYNPETGKIE